MDIIGPDKALLWDGILVGPEWARMGHNKLEWA